jgi:uncharacterized RDD family membrane protein YckC
VTVASGIVTPEAVVLEFETAGIGSRLVARLIDTAIQIVLLVVMLLGSAAIGAVIGSLGLAGVFVSLFVVLFIYPLAFETLWHGRTPGKAALGLRVVTVEGAPVRFRHAAIRSFLGLIDVYLIPGAIGVIAMLLSARSQRLGDVVAGTVVLRERTGAGQPTAVTFSVPLGYESYAASLDVSGLSATDYGAARAFLLRAASLEPSRRYDLARQLATPLLAKLRHSPPSWVGPEAFLACLAAMYQARARGLSAPGSWAMQVPPAPPPPAAPRPPAPPPPASAAPASAAPASGRPDRPPPVSTDRPGRSPSTAADPPGGGYVPPA